jgi:hypothetical protein
MKAATKLNSMQQFMIQLFDRPVNPKQEADIKQLLANYFAEQVDKEMDELWEVRGISQIDLDKALNTHKRTKYENAISH